MTAREEFQQRRDHGLKARHERRLANAVAEPCTQCGASLAACETRQWLSGRACCPSCTGHTDKED